MSKAVKTIVSVVAAIAIPFVAPALASTIGLSGAIGTAVGSATAGSVIGGAITGAALGAAKGAILGEDVGRSALLGGIGGGIYGYAGAPTAAAPTAAVAGAPPPVYDLTSAGLSAAPGYGAAPPVYDLTSAGLSAAPGYTTGLSGGFTSGMEAAALENPVVSGFGTTQAAPATTPTAGLQMPAESAFLRGMPEVSAVEGAGVAGTGVLTGAKPATFMEAIKQVPGQIAAKFTDPKALADLTLRAGGMLAGSLIAGDGLSDEERKLLDAQTEELRTLQQANAGLFAQRLEQAQNLVGESKYFDPEYYGLQRARRTQLAGAKAKRAGLRDLEGASRAAEARRFDLATARDVGSSFDQGYLAGVQGRLNTTFAGMQAMPTSFPSSMGDYGNLRAAYGAADQRARQTQSDIGNLFGSVTGRGAAGGRG